MTIPFDPRRPLDLSGLDLSTLPRLRPERPGLVRSALQSGAYQVLGGAAGLGAATSRLLGAEGATKYFEDTQRGHNLSAAETGRADLEGNPFREGGGSILKTGAYQLLKQVPNVASMVLTGGPLTKGMTALAGRAGLSAANAARAGSYAAGTVGMLPQAVGGMYGQAVERADNGGDPVTAGDAAKAFAMSVPYAAMEALAPTRMIRGLKGGVAGGLGKRLVKGAATGAVNESATEAAQTVLENTFRSDMTAVEKMRNVVDAAVLGGLVGAGFGGIGSIRKIRDINPADLSDDDMKAVADEATAPTPIAAPEPVEAPLAPIPEGTQADLFPPQSDPRPVAPAGPQLDIFGGSPAPSPFVVPEKPLSPEEQANQQRLVMRDLARTIVGRNTSFTKKVDAVDEPDLLGQVVDRLEKGSSSDDTYRLAVYFGLVDKDGNDRNLPAEIEALQQQPESEERDTAIAELTQQQQVIDEMIRRRTPAITPEQETLNVEDAPRVPQGNAPSPEVGVTVEGIPELEGLEPVREEVGREEVVQGRPEGEPVRQEVGEEVAPKPPSIEGDVRWIEAYRKQLADFDDDQLRAHVQRQMLRLQNPEDEVSATDQQLLAEEVARRGLVLNNTPAAPEPIAAPVALSPEAQQMRTLAEQGEKVSIARVQRELKVGRTKALKIWEEAFPGTSQPKTTLTPLAPGQPVTPEVIDNWVAETMAQKEQTPTLTATVDAPAPAVPNAPAPAPTGVAVPPAAAPVAPTPGPALNIEPTDPTEWLGWYARELQRTGKQGSVSVAALQRKFRIGRRKAQEIFDASEFGTGPKAPAPPKKMLPADQVRQLIEADPSIGLGAIAKQLNMDPGDVVDTITDLVDGGWVRPVAPKPQAAPAPVPAPAIVPGTESDPDFVEAAREAIRAELVANPRNGRIKISRLTGLPIKIVNQLYDAVKAEVDGLPKPIDTMSVEELYDETERLVGAIQQEQDPATKATLVARVNEVQEAIQSREATVTAATVEEGESPSQRFVREALAEPTKPENRRLLGAMEALGGVPVAKRGSIAMLYVPLRGGVPSFMAQDLLTGRYLKEDVAKATDAELRQVFPRSEDIATVREMAFVAEAEFYQRRAAYPNGPFAGPDPQTVGTKSLPANVVEYVEGLRKLLKITSRVFVTTLADMKTEGDTHSLHGSFAWPRHVVTYDGYGTMGRFGNGNDYYIVLKDGMKEELMLETLAHEFGHVVMFTAFERADLLTQNAIRNAHDAWRQSMQGKKAKDIMRGTRNTVMAEEAVAGLQGIDMEGARLGDYWTSFDEWTADQVSRWATTRAQPRTLIDKFFKGLAEKLRLIWESLTGVPHVSQTMGDFLDGLAKPTPKLRAYASSETNPVRADAAFRVDRDLAVNPRTDVTEWVPLRLAEGYRVLNDITNPLVVDATGRSEPVLFKGERITAGDVERLRGMGFEALPVQAHPLPTHHALKLTPPSDFTSFGPETRARVEQAKTVMHKLLSPKTRQTQVRKGLLGWTSVSHMVTRYKALFDLGDDGNGLVELADAEQARSATHARLAQLFTNVYLAFEGLMTKKPKLAEKVGTLMSYTEFQIDPAKSWDEHKWLHGSPDEALRQQQVAAANKLLHDLKREKVSDVYFNLAATNEAMHVASMVVGIHNLVVVDPDYRAGLPAGFDTDPMDEFREQSALHESPQKAHAYWRQQLERKIVAAKAFAAAQRAVAADASRPKPERDKAELLARPLDLRIRSIEQALAAMEQGTYFHLGRFGEHFVAFEMRLGDDKRVDPKAVAHVAKTLREAGFTGGQISTDTARPNVYMRLDREDDMERLYRLTLQLQKQGWLGDKEPMRGLRATEQTIQQLAPEWLNDYISMLEASKAFDPADGATPAEQEAAEKRKQAMIAQARELWLDMLPDTALTKVLVQRSSVPGYHPDMMRNFAHRMQVGVNALANLSTAPKITRAFTNMRGAINEAKSDPDADIVTMQTVFGELQQRQNERPARSGRTVVDTLRAVNHAYFLGLSPSYALINLTQVGTLLLPELAKRHGFVKSAKAIAQVTPLAFRVLKATLQTGTALGWKRATDAIITEAALTKSGVPTPIAEFIMRVVNTGNIDIGSASRELGRVAEAGTDSKLDLALRVGASFGYYTETLTRLISALAARQLHGDAPGLDRYVSTTVNESMFNYAASNTARETSKTGVLGRYSPLAFSFMTYQFQLLEKLYREVAVAVVDRAATPEEKAASRRFLASHLMVMTTLAGSLGLPFASVLARAAEALTDLFGDDDEPWDAKAAWRNTLTSMFGEDMGEVLARGVPRAVGVDVSSRAGEADILPFSRLLTDRRKWDDAMKDWAYQMMGSPASMVSNVVQGGAKIADGDVLEGMKAVLPMAMKGPLEAFRMTEEGYIDARGNLLPLSPTASAILSQALGFTPAAKAEYTEAKLAQGTRKGLLTQQASTYRRQLARAVENGDRAAFTTLAQEAAQFDRTNPAYAVLPTLSETVKRRLRARALATTGENPLGVNMKDLGAQRLTTFANFPAR